MKKLNPTIGKHRSIKGFVIHQEFECFQTQNSNLDLGNAQLVENVQEIINIKNLGKHKN
jgi:hypothetical protein